MCKSMSYQTEHTDWDKEIRSGLQMDEKVK